MHDIVLAGALTGLLISAVFGLTAAALGVPPITNWLLRRFRLDGASKAIKSEFQDGIRGYIATFAAIGGVVSAALYILLESGGTKPWIIAQVSTTILVAIVGSIIMVRTRGSFLKKELIVGKNQRRNSPARANR